MDLAGRHVATHAHQRRLRAAAVALCAAAVALAGCGSDKPKAKPPAAARVELRLQHTYPVEGSPAVTATGSGRAFHISEPLGEVTTVGLSSGELERQRVYGGAQRTDLSQNHVTTGLGSLWVLEGFRRRLFRVDPATGDVQDSVATRGSQDLLVAGGRVYTDDFQTERVYVYDADTLELVQDFHVDSPVGMAVSGDELLVASIFEQTLYRFHLGETKPFARVNIRQPYETKGDGPGPERVAVGHGSAWISDPVGNLVTRVPLDGGPTTTIKLGKGGFAWGVATDETGLWVGAAGWLLHVDAATNRVNGSLRTLPVKVIRKTDPDGARDMSVAGDTLWVGEPRKGRLTAYAIEASG